MDDPERIEALLTELVAVLADHGEDRWATAFDRVRDHVAVAVGCADRRAAARIVRDLLHMFAGGMGSFEALQLARDDRPAVDATQQLHALHAELHAVVDAGLR